MPFRKKRSENCRNLSWFFSLIRWLKKCKKSSFWYIEPILQLYRLMKRQWLVLLIIVPSGRTDQPIVPDVSPVCLRKCLVNSSERANRQSQPSHAQAYGFSPGKTANPAYRTALQSSRNLNAKLQANEPVCVRMWALRWELFLYILLHSKTGKHKIFILNQYWLVFFSFR